jgi:hypothetical protein
MWGGVATIVAVLLYAYKLPEPGTARVSDAR